MSFLVIKGQSWAPSDCWECGSPGQDSKEEQLTSFEKRKKEASSQSLFGRLIWLLLHVAIIGSIFTVDTELSKAWKQPHLPYLTSYLVLAIANLALYLNLCLSNPGYLQPGVHALSLATMKRDSEGSLAAQEAAELGIGRLAHIDIPLIGRRTALGTHRERQMRAPSRSNTLDRTTTLPNLPSQFPSEAMVDVSSPGRPWDGLPASRNQTYEGTIGSPTANLEVVEAAFDEAKTESAAGILVLGARALSETSAGPLLSAAGSQVGKVRARGSSLGCEQELHSALGSADCDWLQRREAESCEPLLGKDSLNEHHTNGGKFGAVSLSKEETDAPMNTKSGLLSSSHDRRRSAAWWEGPNPGRWCEYCGAWQLLRSRHCHDCGRCVKRFDHHCAWVGRCIGQDNHLMFWWYLATQLSLLSWTTHIIVEAFEMPLPLTVGRFAVLLACCVPTVLLTGFVAMLFAYHSYLVLTAQTTYEVVVGSESCISSAKVPYLRHLPKGACPFSQGPVQNVMHFCCDGSSTSYQMPAAIFSRRA